MENKLELLVETMVSKGLRMTSQRRWIAEVFSDSTGFVLPKQVHHYISERIPGVSYDTVYRNLRLLTDIGILEQFDFAGGVRFKLRCGPDSHHHHFICIKCEQTYPLDYCPMENVETTPEAFRILSHKFEVYGICGRCGTD
ncbi:transcriptional repressor [Paenibacillus sp. 7541]|uniref:Transcriptional repressor n=2 Tax=Paenibacillus TaxID=44249 RepID=A0A268F081_9BACL|nr:transcriptional repressor [Paenibacillus campinasensis]PAD78743.1 transcriptional repressor [Paenibacillus campinasensis]PAK54419.1 transcriptional repressor [Paenibacillus sp. 7541]